MNYKKVPINLSSFLIPRELRGENLSDAIDYLKSFNSTSNSVTVISEAPIFLFSAGWRSGSTLLQRLVCSDNSVLIWGEPYGDRIPVPRMAATIADFNSNDPTIKYSIENLSGEMSEEWIANLNPGPGVLRSAHLSYFETIFAKPAQLKGYSKWGAKWVRLSAYYAYYLQWLYPRAKFVFLCRHPLSAYHSYKRKKWFSVRPTFRVNSVINFMMFWKYLAASFNKEIKNLNGMLIRYEDLVTDKEVLDRLSDFLSVQIRDDVLGNKVGSRNKKKLKINIFDKLVCRIIVSDIYQRLGYNHSPNI